MIKQQAVWVYWSYNELRNSDYLRKCLYDGWIVSKSDVLRDEDYPDTVIYILEKEFTDHGEQNI